MKLTDVGNEVRERECTHYGEMVSTRVRARTYMTWVSAPVANTAADGSPLPLCILVNMTVMVG